MKAIGPTFSAELEAENLLCLPFSWGADGSFQFGEAMTPEQISGVEAVYAAHDPNALPHETPEEIERSNVTATDARARADALSVIERKIAANAPPAEIFTDFLNLLKDPS